MPSVYIDLLFVLNGCVDGLLLSAVAVFRHLPHRRARFLLGTAVGALSSLVILLPALPAVLLLLYDVAAATLMVFCTFSFAGWRETGKTVGVLFFLSALFSGVSSLVQALLAPGGFYVFNGVVYYDVSPLLLLGCTLLCYGVARVYAYFAARRVPPVKTLLLTVENRGQTVQFTALHDTGFSLCDGFSGSPVVLVDKATAAPLLPADFGKPGSGFRLVPCHTVAGSGLLYAFRPERLTVAGKGGEIPVSGTLLALSDQLQLESFTALCGDDIAKFCT